MGIFSQFLFQLCFTTTQGFQKNTDGRLHARFTESVALSLSGRGNPLKRYHAQFYFSF